MWHNSSSTNASFLSLSLQNQNSSVKLNNVVLNSSNYNDQLQRTAQSEMHFMQQQQRNDAYMAKFLVTQQKKLTTEGKQHNSLSRTVSTPMPIPDANQAVSNLFSSLNDILNSGAPGSGHRKLERTQSEPLPQTNTSR